uniref:Uncharacterized protein n=1 Tax=Setaria italica TaxID=4555 RepID=K4A1N6_SETIT
MDGSFRCHILFGKRWQRYRLFDRASPGCLSFPLVSSTNQVNASLFLCRLVYVVWYPGKCPELQGVLIWGVPELVVG